MSAVGVYDDLTCAKCGGQVSGRTVRFVCPHCGAPNKPNRASMTARAKTESLRDLTRELQPKRRHLRLVTEHDEQRPRTRGECVDGPRPCPWVSCRQHLAYEVTKAGGLKEKFPGLELDELPQTCALDVADAGPLGLDGIAFIMNVTSERVRKIESDALDSFRRSLVFTEDDL